MLGGSQVETLFRVTSSRDGFRCDWSLLYHSTTPERGQSRRSGKSFIGMFHPQLPLHSCCPLPLHSCCPLPLTRVNPNASFTRRVMPPPPPPPNTTTRRRSHLGDMLAQYSPTRYRNPSSGCCNTPNGLRTCNLHRGLMRHQGRRAVH